jgi:hypothetical protein
MKVTRILLVALAVLFIAAFPLNRKTSSSVAQTPQSAALPPGGSTVRLPQLPLPDPPGTIDGSKTPELIPDDVAYRLVLLGIAEPENATPAQQARFRAKIASAKLDVDDTQALVVILAAFQKELDALNEQSKQIRLRTPIPMGGTPAYQQLAELSKQRLSVVAEAMGALPARLSPAGAAQFEAYVKAQKRGMKYVPDTPMKPKE